MEHRWGQRTSVDLVVSLTGLPGAIGLGRLRDVSTTGAFLQTNLELPLLSPVQIELIGGPSPASYSCEGRGYVVRRVLGGVGIEWFTPAPDPVRVPAKRLAPSDFSRSSLSIAR